MSDPQQYKLPVETDGPVDAVVTWVDGDDPAHRAKREAVMAKAGGGSHGIPAGRHEVRFRDNGELAWCIASIRRNLPWIRHIFLITDSQIPAFPGHDLLQEMRVQVVDHKEIFRDHGEALPSFNSFGIESLMWNIKGLATRFLYLNDDFVVLQPVHRDEFFDGDNVVLSGNWGRVRPDSRAWLSIERGYSWLLEKFRGIHRTHYLTAQMAGARLAGFDRRYFRVSHVPHPVRTGTLEQYYKRNPAVLEGNIACRFRSIGNHCPVSLANHLEISSGQAILKADAPGTMFSGEASNRSRERKLLQCLGNVEAKFLCLQSFDRLSPSMQNSVRSRLADLLGLQVPPGGFR